MQKNKIFLAKKTLTLLSSTSWKKISLSSIVKDKNISNIRNKNDLLINVNRYFDYLLKENLSSLEESSKKDMLFEILMARLDILNNNRKSIKNLLSFFISHPNDFIKILPSFVESIILILTLSNIQVSGVKGALNIKMTFFLYLLIIYTWNKDETDSLEKTMTTLDKYLINMDKLFNLFK